MFRETIFSPSYSQLSASSRSGGSGPQEQQPQEQPPPPPADDYQMSIYKAQVRRDSSLAQSHQNADMKPSG